MVGQSHLTNDFGGTNETIIKHNDDDSPGLRKKHVHFLKTFRSTLTKKQHLELKSAKNIFLSKQIEKLLEILVKKFMPKYAFDQTSGTHLIIKPYGKFLLPKLLLHLAH